MDDSDNLQPPFLGQEFALYPELPQLVRVDQPGNGVYSGFVQQWTPPLSLRDREACFVWEPNGITLSPGYYDCRLVGNYLGAPLFVTTCCQASSSSSSSAG